MTFERVIEPGDVLLYKPKGIYGLLIRIKTWHPISHVEIYLGNGVSSASRDGLGVNLYPWRLTELAAILRPKGRFNCAQAKTFTQAHAGTPYGWWDLFNFIGWKVDTKGIVCSPWVTEVLRDNGFPVFNDEPSNLIAPFEFLDTEYLMTVWKA